MIVQHSYNRSMTLGVGGHRTGASGVWGWIRTVSAWAQLRRKAGEQAGRHDPITDTRSGARALSTRWPGSCARASSAVSCRPAPRCARSAWPSPWAWRATPCAKASAGWRPRGSSTTASTRARWWRRWSRRTSARSSRSAASSSSPRSSDAPPRTFRSSPRWPPTWSRCPTGDPARLVEATCASTRSSSTRSATRVSPPSSPTRSPSCASPCASRRPATPQSGCRCTCDSAGCSPRTTARRPSSSSAGTSTRPRRALVETLAGAPV